MTTPSGALYLRTNCATSCFIFQSWKKSSFKTLVINRSNAWLLQTSSICWLSTQHLLFDRKRVHTYTPTPTPKPSHTHTHTKEKLSCLSSDNLRWFWHLRSRLGKCRFKTILFLLFLHACFLLQLHFLWALIYPTAAQAASNKIFYKSFRFLSFLHNVCLQSYGFPLRKSTDSTSFCLGVNP